MLNLKSYIAEAAGKNLHMTHIEDQVIYGGVSGARQAIFALRSLRDMLAGHATKSVNVTVKWDGAPAIFAGTDPSDGKFFVAKKGLFNKNPKLYKTPADVDADTSGDLADKLKTALMHMSKLGIKGVIQGDLMFTSNDLSTETIDGVKYYTFQPNTIVYAVPVDSEAGKNLKSAKMGIVVHTRYTGKDFASMTASFDVKAAEFKTSNDVWLQDANLQDLSGTATLTKADTDEVTKALSEAGRIFQKIAGSTLRDIESNPEFASMIETYNNTFVRANTPIGDTTKHVAGLIKWINAKYQKEMDKRSTQAGKDAQAQKRDMILKFFSPANKANLKLVYDLQKAIVVAKLIIINKLNRLSKTATFVKTKNGFKTTGVEGYVAIDRLNGGAVKLVDRMEFSYNNFSADIIKGWDKASRS